MTDADRRRAERARSELAETEGVFAEVGAAMVKRLFETKPEDGAERERLYLAVNVLDSVRARMRAIVTGHADSKAIEEFVAAMRG
jgi:hypothetical protein